jgi:hypothetical protein
MREFNVRLVDTRCLLKAKEIHDSLANFHWQATPNFFQKLVFHANAAARRDNEALLLLLGSGLDSAALAQSRGLYELGVNVRFVASGGLSSTVGLTQLPTDPVEVGRLRDEVDRRAKSFLSYGLWWMVHHRRRLKLSGSSAAELAATDALNREFGFAKHRGWWPKNLRDMAAEVDEELRYDLVYGLGSDLIHHGAHALLRDTLPDVEWLDGELAIWSSVQDLEYLLRLFELELQVDIGQSLRELGALRQEVKQVMAGAISS